MKSIYKFKLLRFELLGLVIFSLFIFGYIHNSSVYAVAPATDLPIFQPNNCGGGDLTDFSVLLTTQIKGDLYVRLPPKTEPTTIHLYSMPLLGGSCTSLGSITAQTNQWKKIASNVVLEKDTSLVIEGDNVGAEPYAAVASILIIPDSSICVPDQDCESSYKGYSGILQPALISGNTDQIALYQANPISDIKYKTINYYSDGSFLYSSKKLLPLNKNYLAGGVHSTSIQVIFKNGETFSINKSINNGVDWSGSLLVKSVAYKHLGQAAIFVFIGIFILIISLILWISRKIYKKRMYKIEHGLDKYDPNKPSDNDITNPPVIG